MLRIYFLHHRELLGALSLALRRRELLGQERIDLLDSWRRSGFSVHNRVVVHPIDEQNPRRGITLEQCEAADSEILILLSAMDETFFQTVHVLSSHKPHEVAWGRKFRDMFLRTEDGLVGIDMRKIHDLEPAP
jgi:hypothetical protein